MIDVPRRKNHVLLLLSEPLIVWKYKVRRIHQESFKGYCFNAAVHVVLPWRRCNQVRSNSRRMYLVMGALPSIITEENSQ